MAQPRVLKVAGNDALGIYSAHTWHLESSQLSAEFGAAYRTKYDREADDFAVLGYDTAQVIAALSQSGKKFSNEISLGNAGVPYNSARGSLIMNSGTHGSESPVFITKVAGQNNLHILAKIGLPSVLTNPKFRLTEDVRSGGIVSYPNF